MNHFLENYLEEVIPVSFQIQTKTELKRIGKEEPRFTVTMHKIPEKKDLLTSTSLALGEAYMRGEIELDKDLYESLDLFLGEMAKFHLDKKALRHLIFTSNAKKNQEKEVTSHYDIGDDFYRLWLDLTMNYSCAYFKKDTDSLFEAQVNKTEYILKKLQIKKGMTLLDIGCGWGFLLRYAAKKYGIKCVGITLSKNQYDTCLKDIKEDGLEDLVTIERMDYRELKNSGMKFDRIVSVGMIEHVGRENYDLFLENVNAVLKDQGVFLLHFISAQMEHDGDAFIKKYIFPGGVIPSLREIIYRLPEYGFYTIDVESLRRHYTKTLLCWRENFLAHREEIVAEHGEEFARMWELYLASCAATFHNGIIDLHQIVMSKGICNDLAMTRENVSAALPD